MPSLLSSLASPVTALEPGRCAIAQEHQAVPPIEDINTDVILRIGERSPVSARFQNVSGC